MRRRAHSLRQTNATAPAGPVGEFLARAGRYWPPGKRLRVDLLTRVRDLNKYVQNDVQR
jgi:hypothetical protein